MQFSIQQLLIIIGIFIVICVPSIVTYKRVTANKKIILSFTILIQFLYIFGIFEGMYIPYYLILLALWLVLLIWSLFSKSKASDIHVNTMRLSNNQVASELERLFSLKEKGAITAQEYEAMKQKVLNS